MPELERRLCVLSGRCGSDWHKHVTSTYPLSVLAGLYRLAAVGLVTPMRIMGMNLVAKEYVAAQDPTEPALSVLSKFAGAAQQL